MFLGRNRFTAGSFSGEGEGFVNQDPGFLNQGNPPMPNGLQRFLAKKGINSPNDLFNRVQNAPRMSFRRGQ
ncbi:MAG TPA: hypothetical protein GX523_17180 [Desulfitobacterium dehalogenans]|uniref:Uncharacterized protein n=1 Tax=Desulfitobacterium dehalogenans TaxID=36854 RepID=A0A7C7D7W2_9FIRM|nr:hypothetical protein [Desulfitobacterium dehalogenans]